MTDFAYFPIHFISKSILSFLSIWAVYSPIEKVTQEKTIVLNSQKIKQELGDLLDPNNPKKRENLFWTLFSTIQEKLEWDNSKKDNKSI